jgi:hypothetical protein
MVQGQYPETDSTTAISSLPNRWRADPCLHDRYQDLGQAQASPLQPLVCYGHPVVRRRRLVFYFVKVGSPRDQITVCLYQRYPLCATTG